MVQSEEVGKMFHIDNTDLAQMDLNKALAYLTVVVTLTVPGLSFLYFFKLDLFKELDVIKIIFVSLVYSAPLFILNFMTVLLTEPERGSEEEVDEEDPGENGEENMEGKTRVQIFLTSFLTFLCLAVGLIVGGILLKSYNWTMGVTYGVSIVAYVYAVYHLE